MVIITGEKKQTYAHIVARIFLKRRIEMIELYTLPTCGICHMIKTKLSGKDISFIEKNFEEIANKLHIDRAPILKIDENTILTTPSEMVKWINKQ